eukprot:GHRQ01028078.1.p1 GENE.GHRQ01028078.1~~GHRQ01028078.1.p1  ORF type:complete len:339 (+),score=165.19 GHRQ01028078.1:95-1111(+)
MQRIWLAGQLHGQATDIPACLAGHPLAPSPVLSGQPPLALRLLACCPAVLQLSSLHAQLLAVRTEREELAARCQQALASISRAEAELRDRTAELSSALRARGEEAAQAQAAAARDRKDKELLSLEVCELRRELEAVDAELAAAQQDAAHASNRAQGEVDVRRDLEVALERERAAAAMLKEAKELEVGELRRRLKAEHGVRKACERWLKSELKSREEMEGLLLAVRDVALGKGPAAGAAAAVAADEEVGQVQALLASLGAAAPCSSKAAAAPGIKRAGAADRNGTGSSQVAAAAAGQLLLTERKANQSRQEFAKVCPDQLCLAAAERSELIAGDLLCCN